MGESEKGIGDRGSMRAGGANIGTGRRAIQRATAGAVVDVGLAEPGAWSETSQTLPARTLVTVATPDGLVERPHAGSEVPLPVEEAALRTFLAGTQSAAEVERQFSLPRAYLGRALRRRYGSVDNLKRALHGSLLESGLILIEHAMLHVEEMTPAQAMLGAKIAVDAAATVEKSIREAPKTIDFGKLSELADGLARLNAFVTGAGGAPGFDGGLEIASDDTDKVSRL